MNPPKLFIKGLEKAIEAYVRLDPFTLQRLAALTGKVVAVELRAIDVTLYLFPHAQGLQVQGEYAGVPHATLSGTPLDMARLGMRSQNSSAPLSDVQISGDIAVGEQLRDILMSIDIDWEEQLSKVTGDVIAHQIGNAARATRAWANKTAEHVLRDGGDYLHDETRVLPSGAEVDAFGAGVDALRAEVDALEARVQRLHEGRRGAM